MDRAGLGYHVAMNRIPRGDGGAGTGLNGRRAAEVGLSPVFRSGSVITDNERSPTNSLLSNRSVEEIELPEAPDFLSGGDVSTVQISEVNTVEFRAIESEDVNKFTGEFVVSGVGIKKCLRALDVLDGDCKVKYAILFGALIGMGRDPVGQYIGLEKPSGLGKNVSYTSRFNEEKFLELVASVLVMLRSIPDTDNFNHIRAGLFLGLARICGFIAYSSSAQFYRTTDWVRILIGQDLRLIAKGVILLRNFLEKNQNLILASKFKFLKNLVHGVQYLTLTLEFLNSDDSDLEWTREHLETFDVMYNFVKKWIEKNSADNNLADFERWISGWYAEQLNTGYTLCNLRV
jgi:hypothetical protein